MMVRATPHKDIWEMVAGEFSCSPRTVERDIALVRKRWDRDERQHKSERREYVVRGLRENAEACLRDGDLKGHRQALATLGRLLCMGMPSHLTVNQDNRRQTVNVLVGKIPSDPLENQKWLDEYVRCRKELDAKVMEVKPETNGHA